MRGCLALPQLAQLAGAARNHGCRNRVPQPRGRCVGPHAEGKDVEIRERQAVDQRERRLVIRLGFAGEAGNHIGAEAEDGQARGQPCEPRAVRLGGVPMPAHALQYPVRARLQRRVQMRREVTWRFDQQARDRVVDFGRLDGGETKAHVGDSGDQCFEQLAQRNRPVLSVGADVNAGSA